MIFIFKTLFAEVRDILKTFKPGTYCPVAEVPSEIAEHQVAEADQSWCLNEDQRKTEVNCILLLGVSCKCSYFNEILSTLFFIKAIYKAVEDMLNNLKPETFRNLDKKFRKLQTKQINTGDRLKGVLDLILQKVRLRF